MKKYIFSLIMVIVTGTNLLAQGGSQSLQAINTSDTVVFDLSQAVITGNYVEFPVSMLTDDTVYSLDFSLKFNQLNLTYDSIINLTGYLQPFSFLNSNDSILRFTSYSLQSISNDTVLIKLRFTMLNTQLNQADFYSLKAYLNGTQCSVKLANVLTIGISEWNNHNNGIKVYPNPSNGILSIESPEKGTFECLDMFGKSVVDPEHVNADEKQLLNLHHLQNGIYMLRLWNNQHQFTRKITISK